MWTTALAATILFFAIQIGTGFSILAIAPATVLAQCRLTKAQFIVLGCTVGLSANAILLGLISLLTDDIRIQLGIIVAIAGVGLVVTWPSWCPRRSDASSLALWFGLSLPVALMTWWWTFGAFSHFPFGDIGADVHWMKIAQEYADGGILNPYATQSYIDLRASLAGALSGTLGLDLLQFSWTYRYGSILFILLTLYVFAEGVYPNSPQRKWIAFAIAAAGNSIGLLTNGSLAIAGSMAFLGVLFGHLPRQDVPQTKPVLQLLFGAAAALAVAFAINNNTLLLMVLMAGLFMLKFWRGSRRGKAILLTGCVWPLALVLAHRGSYLFVPTTLAAWTCYVITRHMMSRPAARTTGFLDVLSLAFPVAIAGIVGGVLAMRLGYISSVDANESFSRITELTLGRAISSGDELSLGAGPQVATIEIGRSMGPLFAICITLAVAWCWFKRGSVPSRSIDGRDQDPPRAKLLWSWTFGCGLVLAALSGFPFLYRATPLALSLLTLTATEAFCLLLVDPDPSPRYRRGVAAATIVALAAVFVIAVYAFAWRADLPYAGYQIFLRPSEIAAIVVLVALLPLTMVRSKPVYLCSLVGVVALGIAVDRAGLSGISRIYSYGPLPASAAAVSHYNAEDLDAARWLHDNLRKGIILSDPYTQGFAQALTGAPAGYLFSNLDTVNEAVARQVKAVLAAIVQSGDGGRRLARTCGLITPLLLDINQQTIFQMRRKDALEGILKPVRPAQEPNAMAPAAPEPETATEEMQQQAVQSVLKSGKGAPWHLVAIVNPRTIEWTRLAPGERLSYFPPAGPMEPSPVKTLTDGTLPILFSNNQTIVVRIPCSE